MAKTLQEVRAYRNAIAKRNRDTVPGYARIPPGMISSGELIARSGITMQQFRVYCHRNLLKPSGRLHSGWQLYRESDVEKLGKLTEMHAKARMSGGGHMADLRYNHEDAELVLPRLREGEALIDIYLATKIHPVVLGYIKEDYEKMTGAMMITRKALDRIAELGFEGEFPIVRQRQLMALLETLAVDRHCTSCHRRPQQYCRSCANRMGRKAEKKEEATAEGRASAAAE